MSLKQKLFSGLTLVFAIAAFTTFASAQDNSANQQDSVQKQEGRGERGWGRRDRMGKEGMMGRRHGGGGGKMMRGLSQLNLTDTQKQQIQTLRENLETSTRPQREEMRNLAMKKRDGVITEQENTRFKELKAQLRASGDQVQNSVLAILTPDQRAQLNQMKEERQQKMKERRENRQNRQLPDTKNDN